VRDIPSACDGELHYGKIVIKAVRSKRAAFFYYKEYKCFACEVFYTVLRKKPSQLSEVMEMIVQQQNRRIIDKLK
jgi:hypothetical protein